MDISKPLFHQKPSEGRVLVTGGAGLIGSALVWALNQRGNENIVICDRLFSDEKWRNLVPLKFQDYVDGSDFQEQVLKKPDFYGKFDLVLHLGACSATTERDSNYLMQNNFELTKNLSKWALSSGSRFVYASSAATYGDGSHGMSDTMSDLTQLRPLNMYGYSKHLFDLYAQRHGFLQNLVGLKYFNVFGPNEDHKADMRSVVHKSYQQILTQGKISLFRSHRPDYQDGEQTRDFLYVKDAAAMTLHLADTPNAGGLFNIGSGESNTWVRLAKAIFAALQKDPVIEFVDMPETLREKYQYHTLADISKLLATGYESKITTLEDSVRDYVVNYLMRDARLGDEHHSDQA